MSKFLVVCALLCLTAVVLAEAGEKQPHQLTKAAKHIAGLVTKIKNEQKQGKATQSKRKVHCMSTSKAHIRAIHGLNRSNAARRHSIQNNETKIRKARATVGQLKKKIAALKKKAEKQSQEIAAADKARLAQKKKFEHRVRVAQRHVAFVRKLFAFIMGSTVERRRKVSLIEKASEVSAHAAKVEDNETATLMELTAQAMTKGHLDHIYRLLDELRAKIQSGVRQAVRAEKNADREWVRRSSRRRRDQLRTWKEINHTEESVADIKMGIAQSQDHNAHSEVKIERNEVQLEHRHRDAKILAMRCQRWKAQYATNVKAWASEIKALKTVAARIAAHKWN